MSQNETDSMLLEVVYSLIFHEECPLLSLGIRLARAKRVLKHIAVEKMKSVGT